MAEDTRPDVERARRGDREAFGRLVKRYQRRVFMTAYRMTGSHDDSNDVAQEAFIRAYRALGSFDGKCDFFTWLYRIVVNVALNHLRRGRKHATVPIEEVELPEETTRLAGPDPKRALELKRMVRDIGIALDELPDTLRATVVLVIMEQMPYREAAEILECSEGTVAWRIHEARQKLKARLGEYLDQRLDSKEDAKRDELPGDTGKALDVRR
jgi:RNA polymerase sigma-70 factor, ECF subfamily